MNKLPVFHSMGAFLFAAIALHVGSTTDGVAAGEDRPQRFTKPEVWLCTARIFDLTRPDARWDYVRTRLTGIQLYIDKVNKAPAENLQKLAAVVRANNLKVSVECGGTLGFAPLDARNGESSARIELAKLDKWRRAGGRIDYLNLDGPVRRLLYPRRGKKRGAGFTSIEDCANELMDYIRAVKAVYPGIRFFLLTNFPNWGYRGRTSYHARGPKQQDWGDYDIVIRTVLKTAKEQGIRLAGVTVDNPYEYAVGEHFSVKLERPDKTDWLRRVRAYEEFARTRGLEFNLIINSEKGGKTSDRAFYERTLRMLDAYVRVGGKPTRYIVQSWYKFPETIVPETAPYSMTALVKAVMEKLAAAGPPRP
ncbi:MAG: hypothetical protein GXP31_01455 [Kiritimatiellaeota bacterium]|nr:hypothetical protein [Kiritimatiellota bacterium]